MSDMKATVELTNKGFSVCGYEKIVYDFEFVDGVFDTKNRQLADCYTRWQRCLAVLKTHKTMVGEKAKSMETLLEIVDSMSAFGIYRKEPVLVIGGGLVTDVAGFACAAYRGNTNYIRIPTTGKCSTCCTSTARRSSRQHLGGLIVPAWRSERRRTGYAARGIYEMLKLETPNLHELMLDRIIAYGHTWSPLHELVPDTPLRHGHAISIDMAYSTTLALQRSVLSPQDHDRLLTLFSRAGLSMDHHQFDEPLLKSATAAILRTRDGKLRAAVPISPMGKCIFLNDVSHEEMCAALAEHKKRMKSFPRAGEGIDAYVDASDTGYTVGGGSPGVGAGDASAPRSMAGVRNSSECDIQGILNGSSSAPRGGALLEGPLKGQPAVVAETVIVPPSK
ncbi:hypothetical protein B0H63DRAFT_562828 [Podospora didyma]|uniref:3-dehydroquinate synthase domain-containing protein n=1 Tax=Podospora didyma TaxID=330526 RepID=A0AAE0KES5_9PEZI|nr:hypothetical protein B0H63DRAFT_562828 [Podospora didyma]